MERTIVVSQALQSCISTWWCCGTVLPFLLKEDFNPIGNRHAALSSQLIRNLVDDTPEYFLLVCTLFSSIYHEDIT